MCSNPHDSKLKIDNCFREGQRKHCSTQSKESSYSVVGGKKNRKYSLAELASKESIGFCEGKLRPQKRGVLGAGDSTRHTGGLKSPLTQLGNAACIGEPGDKTPWLEILGSSLLPQGQDLGEISCRQTSLIVSRHCPFSEQQWLVHRGITSGTCHLTGTYHVLYMLSA